MEQKSMETRGKSAFFRPAFLGISSVFSLIYLVFLSIKSPFSLQVWHLWQQKINIAVGRRAYIRVGTRRLDEVILQGWYINFCVLKNKMSLFRDFFPLWGHIDPYTYRGASLRSTSRYDSTFTAKANLIYRSLCLHIPPSFVGQWLDGTVTHWGWNSQETVKWLLSSAKDF